MTVSKFKFAPVESCCTCATLLSKVPRYSISEKPLPQDRELECCRRVICGHCRNTNPRFNTYCPYCQISITDTSLPQGLKDPPSYESSIATSSSKADSAAPPPYMPPVNQMTPDPLDEKSVPLDSSEPAEDTLHFLDHAHDSIASLSLRYGVPASALRRANNITSDHLILGRRTVIIPGEYYKGGVSLSPRPIEGEEEEARKSKIRRWMVACKVHEYDVAVLYLEQAAYDLEMATEAFFADEAWERAHPVEAAKRGKGVAKRANSRSAFWRGHR
ncbi:uncharacterized protein F4807DRAFT_307050 [Annulohypoxylon truncatum]|uniref:uncharacterized protein n=1 Tax=Annulohypoxylon truncatum TaxID=327061 RepID=UPI002007BA5A|nr:uncharacterized protein F4807DRAFT_307050 [Annulohypoxylon truncatum]KAI1212977.1 hypothetical protein F4807DRAFT_307050 [Annulohypoxylon truncatum]